MDVNAGTQGEHTVIDIAVFHRFQVQGCGYKGIRDSRVDAISFYFLTICYMLVHSSLMAFKLSIASDSFR